MEIIYTTYFFYQYAFYIVGTRAYDKLQAIIMNNSILNDVKKLSPDAQTSQLEGFHSTLNTQYPKMICFSLLGTYCMQICNLYNVSAYMYTTTLVTAGQ